VPPIASESCGEKVVAGLTPAGHATALMTDTMTGTMTWLPCLRRGSDRWWLPRSAAATDLVTRILLDNSGGSLLQEPVERCLISDPALFVFCALHLSNKNESASNLTTKELADWLISNAATLFASGNAFLGAPDLSDQDQIKIAALIRHYQSLPIQQWVQDAVLWLEAFGPKVSAAWQQQWPTILVASNGTVLPTESEGGHDSIQNLARTVQRLRSLETAFDARLQKSKLDAIKQLAYGLSHEINNPLANISTRAQSLKRDEQDATKAATLQRIVDQVFRAHEMIADLMFYANPSPTNPKPCDLVAMIQNVVDGFRDEADRQAIRIEVSVPRSEVRKKVDETMFAEALRVLIRNAIEAIGCQGTIVVSLVAGEGPTQIHVADSGPGLSAEARQHAFDPYFSGREAGRGLGLGLCRAYRITQLHGAELSLASGPAGCVATIQIDESDRVQS
jgi:signal transduction histidine kinase